MQGTMGTFQSKVKILSKMADYIKPKTCSVRVTGTVFGGKPFRSFQTIGFLSFSDTKKKMTVRNTQIKITIRLKMTRGFHVVACTKRKNTKLLEAFSANHNANRIFRRYHKHALYRCSPSQALEFLQLSHVGYWHRLSRNVKRAQVNIGLNLKKHDKVNEK